MKTSPDNEKSLSVYSCKLCMSQCGVSLKLYGSQTSLNQKHFGKKGLIWHVNVVYTTLWTDLRPTSCFIIRIRKRFIINSFSVHAAWLLKASYIYLLKIKKKICYMTFLLQMHDSTTLAWVPSRKKYTYRLNSRDRKLLVFWKLSCTLRPSIFITIVHPAPPHAPRPVMWQYTGNDNKSTFKE